MEKCSNKLVKIKHTLGELRNDIEKMKLVINFKINIIFKLQKNDKAINIIANDALKHNKKLNKNQYYSKKYNSFMENKDKNNKFKNKINMYNKDNNFNTQKINNNILNEIITKQSPNIKESNQKDKFKNIQSIEQYEYIDYGNGKGIKKNEKNKLIMKKNYYYTQHDNSSHGIKNKNLLIQTKINDIINNNKNNSNSLSNILKNKKMISSPILDSNLEFLNYIKFKNNEENNENDINEINGSIENNNLLNNEIEELKKEIASIQENNNILLNKLNEEKNKNNSLTNLNKEEENMPNDIEIKNILTDISNCLQVDSFDEIESKLNEMIEYLNTNIYEKNEENIKKNELISKLQELYLSMNEKNNKNEEISIKVLWRWIKYLINNYKSLLSEKDKNLEILNNLKEKDNFYKDFCLELMNKYKAKNLEELNKFIEELIKKNKINKKRVEQLKKILISDNNNKKNDNNNNNLNLNLLKGFKNRNNEDITFKNNQIDEKIFFMT